jgi:hypothetical protein
MRFGIIAAALSLSVTSCGTRDEARLIQASADDDGNLGQVTLPSGTVTDGPDEYEAAVAAETPPIEEMGTYELTVKTPAADGGASGMRIGRFRVRIVPDANYLSGCINRSFLHLKVTVTSDVAIDQAFVELHLLAWFEKSQPCFAVMNTGFIGYGWCQKVCLKDVKKGVATTIAGGLAAAGVSASIAKVSSYLIAPIATAALAL